MRVYSQKEHLGDALLEHTATFSKGGDEAARPPWYLWRDICTPKRVRKMYVP